MRGETPHQEERQLEQLAEEDPFLAEALEGYRRHPEGKHAERVEQLKARLRERRGKNRGLIYYLPRLAAAVVALAITAGGFWYINQQGPGLSAFAVEEKTAQDSSGPDTEQAMEERNREQASAPAASARDESASVPELKKEKDRAAGPAEPPPKAPAPKQRRKAKKSQVRSDKETPQIAQAKPLPTPAETRLLPPVPDEAEEFDFQEDKIVMAEKEEAEKEKQYISAATARLAAPQAGAVQPAPRRGGRKIHGLVEGEGGEPLIGANVLVEGTTQGAVTDIEGSFTLELPDSLDTNLIISYTGYASKEVSPGKEDSLLVVLSEGDALLESVTVTGYSVPREKPTQVVRPEEGFEGMRKYIRDNLRYPEAARSNGIEGKVRLTFRIQADGTPGNIEVRKGLGYGCDEEAIRLLKEGPKWEGAGQEANYTVRFKLKN